VGTALIYLLVVVAVAAAVFGVAAAVFGRGEELAPLPPGATPTHLPAGEVDGEDVRSLRFPQALRGYRMAEVDWVLERLAAELDRVGTERDGLAGRIAELEARIAELDRRPTPPGSRREQRGGRRAEPGAASGEPGTQAHAGAVLGPGDA
jgi:DivIVA domain-containing protein